MADLQIVQHEDWVEARLSGELDAEKIPRQYTYLAEQCERANTKRLLVDITRSGMSFSLMDRFRMGEQTTIFGRHGIKVAVVANPDQVELDRFAELVAVNRAVNIRVFTDLQAAEQWLVGE